MQIIDARKLHLKYFYILRKENKIFLKTPLRYFWNKILNPGVQNLIFYLQPGFCDKKKSSQVFVTETGSQIKYLILHASTYISSLQSRNWAIYFS